MHPLPCERHFAECPATVAAHPESDAQLRDVEDVLKQLGIDVHDIMNRWARLENNNVITVEPGLYIPEWGIGVRIENDVVIRPEGNEDLMAGLPIEVEEIESLMNS